MYRYEIPTSRNPLLYNTVYIPLTPSQFTLKPRSGQLLLVSNGSFQADVYDSRSRVLSLPIGIRS